MHVVTILIVLLPLLLAAALLWVRRRHELALRDELSPISRQHIDLFQGGQLSESAVESTKARFRDLLERGEVAAVESCLRPGMQYVVQVRALTELGTDDAGRILERQLHRRLTDDQIEQAWYWIDLANGLRALNRVQSLPHLLRCAEAASDPPLGQFFAAETICFLGFSGYLHQFETQLGRSALRVLHRALEGLRFGVPPNVVAEARVGELIETLWDNRTEQIDPLAVHIYVETLRLLRRAPHAEALLSGEAGEQEAFNWQMSRLTALEPALTDFLQEAPALLAQLRSPNVELVLEVLTWSSHPRIAPLLREWVLQNIPMVRRAQYRRKAAPPRRSSIPAELPYCAILRTLRGHPSPQTEAFLLLAARDWDPMVRQSAVGSLGWWEPLRRHEVLLTLQDARRDPNSDVRQAARAALARLGERQALAWFRQTLTSEDPQRVHDTIQTVAAENLTLLWPDLDRLADADDADVAHHAREALERLCEDMNYRHN
jgi:hypothetical protein